MQKRNDRKSTYNAISIATGAGFTLLGMIGLGIWIGLKVDQFLQTKYPLGLIIGGLIGAFMGIYSMIHQTMEK